MVTTRKTIWSTSPTRRTTKRAFAYDALGRVTQVTFPSSLSESYTYDDVNNLLSKTDRKGQTINYGYDALYRLTSKTYPDSTAVNYTYDLLSRLTQATDPTGAYSVHLRQPGTPAGHGHAVFIPERNAHEQLRLRRGLESHFADRSGGRLDELQLRLAESADGADGLPFGTVRVWLRCPGAADFLDAAEWRGHVLHLRQSLAAAQRAAQRRELAGERHLHLRRGGQSADEDGPPAGRSQRRFRCSPSYSYDPIYELTQAVVGGSLAESYTYDAVGNRLTSVSPASYTYNSSNQLTSSSAATYTYDANGNTLTKTDSTGTTYYTWDYENRLTSVTLPGTGGTVNFKYDPFGRRIEKITPARNHDICL